MPIIFISFCTASFATDTKTVGTKTAGATAQKAVPKMPVPPKPNFSMIAGTITSIDNSDPSNVKISVKNDADGSSHIVTVTPWTNITKVTDVSDLKTGEPIRMMARKVDDKDIAMGIMFGKVKTAPVPAHKTLPATKVPPAAPAK